MRLRSRMTMTTISVEHTSFASKCAHCNSPFDSKSKVTKAFMARVIRKGKELVIRVAITTALQKLHSWKFHEDYEFEQNIQFCELCGLAIARLYGAWEVYDKLSVSDSYLSQLLAAGQPDDLVPETLPVTFHEGHETQDSQSQDDEQYNDNSEHEPEDSQNYPQSPDPDEEYDRNRSSAEEAANLPAKANLCYICAKSFDKQTNLRRHLLMTHEIGERQKDFVCPVCGKSFHFGYILKKHMVYHSDERPVSCPLEGCEQKFKHKNCLNHHLRLCHSNERPFACKHCPKSFKIRRDRDKHEKYVHKTPKGVKYACIHGCGLRYKRKSTMITHARINCPKRPYSGSEDEASTEAVPGENHGPEKSKDKSARLIKCENGCGKIYKSKATRREHYRRGRCKFHNPEKVTAIASKKKTTLKSQPAAAPELHSELELALQSIVEDMEQVVNSRN